MEAQRRQGCGSQPPRLREGAQALAQATHSGTYGLLCLSDKLTQWDKGRLLGYAPSWPVGLRLALGEPGAEERA